MSTEQLKSLIVAWFINEGDKPGRGYVGDLGKDLTIDGDFDIEELAKHILRNMGGECLQIRLHDGD